MSINHAAKICWTILLFFFPPMRRRRQCRRVGETYSTGIVGNGIDIIKYIYKVLNKTE